MDARVIRPVPTHERVDDGIQWPVKRRDMHNHHFDSTIWDQFDFRDDDVIIATYAKSGTTWMQQIIGQIVFEGQENLPISDLSPWLDLRVPPKEIKLPILAKQTHRRFVKTHLPVDALVYSPDAKYIYIGRDGRDVVWSLYNHHRNANVLWYMALNDTPGRVGPPIEPPVDDVVDYFQQWFDADGFPFWPFWENVRSWWAIRDLPNLMLIHFEDLKADLPGSIDRIAAFLDAELDADLRETVQQHCTFEYMRTHCAAVVPMAGTCWDGGAETFFHRGENGRWRDLLSAETIAAYENRAVEELGEACAEWLMTGRRADLTS